MAEKKASSRSNGGHRARRHGVALDRGTHMTTKPAKYAWQNFNAARTMLKHAKGALDDNGWPRSESWHKARQEEVNRAEKRYEKARAAWEAAGRPQPPKRRRT